MRGLPGPDEAPRPSSALGHEFERGTGTYRVMDPGPTRIAVAETRDGEYEQVRRLLAALPRRWRCLRCGSPWQALHTVQRATADVMIVALGEQIRPGLELIRQARAESPRLVLLALSDRPDARADLEAQAAGADGFLVRGEFDAASLDRTVRYADRLRKTTGTATRQSGRYEQVLDALGLGVWDIDLHGLDVYVCERAARLLGIANAATIRLQGLATMLEPAARRAVLSAANACISGASPSFNAEFEIAFRSEPEADPEPRWMRLEGKLTRDEAGRPHRLTGSVIDVTERKQAERAMQRYAFRDTLTDLPNRRLLERRLSAAISGAGQLAAESGGVRHGAAFGLLYVDLDGFKPINDQFGHDAGDDVLKEVARRLTGCVRRDDTVARVGGDEFVVLLQGPIPSSSLERMRGEIRRAIRRPILAAGHTVSVDASVGTAIEGHDGDGAAELLANADQAMYREKRSRKSQRAANNAPSGGPPTTRSPR